MKKWKLLPILILILIKIVIAEDIQLFTPAYGDSQLYVKETGDNQLNNYFFSIEAEAIDLSGQGVEGGAGGAFIICEEDEFLLFGRCLPNIFKTIFDFWNQSVTAKWFDAEGGVLAYSITIPKTAKLGEDITIINQFTNEGDMPVEISCDNFLDINHNGTLDKDDVMAGFNKRLFVNKSVEFNISLRIPADIEKGRYFIGGECELLDSEQPDANAFATIEIKDLTPDDIIARLDAALDTKDLLKKVIIGLLIIAAIVIAFKSGLISYLFGLLQTVLIFLLFNIWIVAVLLVIGFIVLLMYGIL